MWPASSGFVGALLGNAPRGVERESQILRDESNALRRRAEELRESSMRLRTYAQSLISRMNDESERLRPEYPSALSKDV